MARPGGLLQNHCALTLIVFAVIAVLVAYKTVQTNPFPDGLEGHLSTQSLKLAHVLMRAKPLKPDTLKRDAYVSGAGYPIVIATVASFDHRLKNALRCHKPKVPCDPSAFKSLFALQFCVALLGLGAIFLLAWVLSRSWSVALLTLIFSFIAGSYGGLAGQLSPIIWLQTTILLFLLFVALAATRDDLRWTLAAGVMLGCSALFMPQLLLVGLVTALFFWLFGQSKHLTLAHPHGQALALVTGMALAISILFISPWSVELANASKQNLAGHLSDRIALNTAGFQSWIGYILATPGIFMRGLWVGTPILTLLGLLHLPSLMRFSREDLRLGPTLLVALPILSLAVINTLVTANRPEYNVGLVFLLCYATAYLIGRTDIRRMFWADKERAKGTQ